MAAMVFLSDRGQKIVSPYRGWFVLYIVAQATIRSKAPLSGHLKVLLAGTKLSDFAKSLNWRVLILAFP